MNMTSKIGETLLVARWGRTLTVWYGSYKEHAWTAYLFLHAGRADYPCETARGLTSCFFKERWQVRAKSALPVVPVCLANSQRRKDLIRADFRGERMLLSRFEQRCLFVVSPC